MMGFATHLNMHIKSLDGNQHLLEKPRLAKSMFYTNLYIQMIKYLF